MLHDKPDASWEDTDENVEIKEEGGPGGGLVLRDTGYDGNVDLGITGMGMEQQTCSTHAHTDSSQLEWEWEKRILHKHLYNACIHTLDSSGKAMWSIISTELQVNACTIL